MVEYMSNRYKLTEKLGEGVHGIVLKAIDLTSNKDVAIKKVSLRTKHGDISLSTIREIKVLQNCDCTYVSRAIGHFDVNKTSISLQIFYVDNEFTGHLS